jgi:hypothetical protein
MLNKVYYFLALPIQQFQNVLSAWYKSTKHADVARVRAMLNKVLCICFTDTKVPILTKKTLLAVRGRLSRRACAVQECVWDACKALACCWGGALVSGTRARPGIHVCVRVCWNVCMLVCMDTYVHIYIWSTCVCVYVGMCVYVGVYIYLQIYIHMILLYICMYKCMCIYMDIYLCVCVCVCVYFYGHICLYIYYIYIYTYMWFSLYMLLPACSRCCAPYRYAPYAKKQWQQHRHLSRATGVVTTCWHALPFNKCSACWKQWQQRLRRASADCRPKK